MDSAQAAEAQNTESEDPASVIEKLQKEKQELETDFATKRSLIKDLFLQKEDELKKEKEVSVELEAKLKQMEAEHSMMKEEMDKVKWELEGVRTAAAVSEGNKEEEINNIMHNYQQEVASLQQLLQEATETATDNTAVRYETERNKLVSLTENYEEEIQELRTKLSQEREGFLSTVAKSIKRVGNMGSSSSLNVEHENLEESMKKAQEDAQLLRSVVVPLEVEIKTLKSKLEATEARLAESEDKLRLTQEGGKHSSAVGNLTADRKSPSLPEMEGTSESSEKTDKLYQYLKAEKAARTDLEMYVAVLTTQKNVLQDDADKVKNHLEDVCEMLEEEKQSHNSLKQTWQMANDQFLESQRLLMMDLRRMEGVLSTEQQRQIAELKKASYNIPRKKSFGTHRSESPRRLAANVRRDSLRSRSNSYRRRRNSELQHKDEEREAQKRKVAELAQKRSKQEKEVEERRKLSQSKMERERHTSSASNVSDVSSSGQLSTTQQPVSPDMVSGAVGGVGVNGAKGGDEARKEEADDVTFLDSGIHDIKSSNGQEEGIGKDSTDAEGRTSVKISPEKVLNFPALTAAQLKAITDPTPETEAHKSLMASMKSKSSGPVHMEGKRMVSEREWTLLHEEMRTAREKLGRPCSMCSNYEAQLQSVQAMLKSSQSDVKHLELSLTAKEQKNDDLLQYQTELEEALKKSAEDAESEIINLVRKVTDCENYVMDFKKEMFSTSQNLEDHCKSLIENRESIQQELLRLQAENDSLVDKYSKTAQQLQNEDINLPNNLEEMQLLLLKYREEIISAKVAKEHTEETLKSERAFLKAQVLGEQQERSTLEETLSQEITSLQSKLTEFEALKKELEQEATTRAETETKLRETESSLKSIQAKSKQLIGKMQERLEDVEKRKTKAEQESHSLKAKVQSLQVDLDNSEAVQRDFVKLSQSLQIQLEKIRQAETEVRWQHEDDIDDCSNCKQSFSVTKRKHHCRHCGRIFCSDCTIKTVNSGPNFRPAKVCDVCHTILVKDATPYFSTEPPATPD